MNFLIGQRGRIQHDLFEIIEIIQRESESELAYDAILLVGDGAIEGRLIEAPLAASQMEHQYLLLVAVHSNGGQVSPPGFDTLKIGQRVSLGDDSFEITEIQRFRFRQESMHQIEVRTWTWLVSRNDPQEWALVEYTQNDAVFFRGRVYDSAGLARIFI